MLLRRYQFLHTVLSPIGEAQLLERIDRAMSDSTRLIIGNHNLHSVYCSRHDSDMACFIEAADIVYCDGAGVVAVARACGVPVGMRHRTTALDWHDRLLSRCEEAGRRVMIIGGKPALEQRFAVYVRSRWPQLTVRVQHGYFDKSWRSAENEAVLGAVREFRPDLLLVGMGMPIQEKWLWQNRGDIQASVVVAVGALFDYLVGEIPTPPRWMGRIGLEWLYRLASEPRRLGRRYLLEPWAIAWWVVQNLFWRERSSRGRGN